MTPSNRRRIVLAVALGLLALGVYLLRDRGDAAARPHLPASDAETVERLPTGSSDPRARELARMRRELDANPTDLPIALLLARRNIEESRVRSDPRYLGYAQAALAPWWSLPDPPPEVRVLRATIRQSTHDFDGALADLDAVVRETPSDPQAWITRSVVEAVRGDYDAARESCAPLTRLTSPLVTVVCYSSIDSLTGSAHPAFARLSSALAMRRVRGGGASDALDSEGEWATATLAEIAARGGDAAGAEQLYVRALTADPTDTYALAAWSDLLLDHGRAKEVASRLAGRESNDGLLLRLALAEDAAKLPRAAEHTRALHDRFEASHARGDVVHRREESRFALALEHDPATALALARANWDVQKEPWDVRVYLEAASGARDPGAAAPVLAFLDRTHLEDPEIARLASALRGSL